jgi:hypothetical protein
MSRLKLITMPEPRSFCKGMNPRSFRLESSIDDTLGSPRLCLTGISMRARHRRVRWPFRMA